MIINSDHQILWIQYVLLTTYDFTSSQHYFTEAVDHPYPLEKCLLNKALIQNVFVEFSMIPNIINRSLTILHELYIVFFIVIITNPYTKKTSRSLLVSRFKKFEYFCFQSSLSARFYNYIAIFV